MVTQDPRILVVGCGGIGGVIAATLLEQEHALVCVTRRPEIAQALRLRGMDLRDENGQRLVTGALEVHEEVPTTGRFDYVLLATQPNQVEAAARAAAPVLAEGGSLVCLQNGLCEERLARIVGRERVIGAVVAWGASSPSPGVFERTASGGFTLGRLDGSVDEKLSALAVILEALGPVDISRNLVGARWSKLALNCAVSSMGTVAGERLGKLLVHRFARRLALEIMSEAVVVARAENVRLQKISGAVDLDWIALTREERAVTGSPSLLAKHALLLAVGARYRRMRSSMLAAIERGREPPVDFLNGEIVDRGRLRGIPTPLNERIQALVHAIARKEARSGMDTLERLYDETRVFRTAAAA